MLLPPDIYPPRGQGGGRQQQFLFVLEACYIQYEVSTTKSSKCWLGFWLKPKEHWASQAEQVAGIKMGCKHSFTASMIGAFPFQNQRCELCKYGIFMW